MSEKWTASLIGTSFAPKSFRKSHVHNQAGKTAEKSLGTAGKILPSHRSILHHASLTNDTKLEPGTSSKNYDNRK